MILIVVTAVLGIAVAPLIRRAIDQVPGRHPLLSGGSGQAFRPPELIPVASWFGDEPAGTTTYVGSPDDRLGDDEVETVRSRWRAPFIDLATACVFAVLASAVGWTWSLPAFLVFGAALVAVTVIDIDHYRIPDRIVFPTLAFCVPVLGIAAVLDDLTGALIAAAAGAVAYFLFLFVFFFVYPKGMGFGDVKLALVLGLHVGWIGAVARFDGDLTYVGWEVGMQLVLMSALIGSLLGAVLGIGSTIVRGRKGAFPFGPALCLGALLAIGFSSQLVN